jgi:hypothetical protein
VLVVGDGSTARGQELLHGLNACDLPFHNSVAHIPWIEEFVHGGHIPLVQALLIEPAHEGFVCF